MILGMSLFLVEKKAEGLSVGHRVETMARRRPGIDVGRVRFGRDSRDVPGQGPSR